jgi:hypothetical protein
MKNIGIVGLIMLLLMSCQSSDDGMQETWDVTVSRATTNGENILVVGKKNGSEQLRGILIPSTTENSLAQWQGTKPSWPGNDNLDMFVISPVPSDKALPQSINVNDGKIWMVDYQPSTYKPNKFTLEHLMAKLKVHIRINNNPNHKRPLNTQMALHTQADIDYSNKGLKNLSGRSRYNVSLGSFTEDGETDNWVSDELLILPQTLERGKKCLRFTVSGGDEYTFSPEDNLLLQPGKINHLYLGVAFENLDLILIGNGTSITDWSNGGSNNGEAVEN